MKISSKGRYAVRVMAELAKNQDKLVSAIKLSENQGISIKYLEQILSILSKAKLIESVRGSLGGYRLTKKINDYSIADILIVTNDLPQIAPCLAKGKQCPRIDNCDSIGCWENLSALIVNYLKSISLSDITKKK